MLNVLENGHVRKHPGDHHAQPQAYLVARLGEDYLPQVMGLQSLILKTLSRPDLMASISADFMREHFEERGFILGMLVDHRLIAYRIVYFPRSMDKEFNMGFEMGLSESQRSKVANLQMVCVHPDYRGNSLALKLNRIAIRLLREQRVHHHVFATVSPYNVWNVRILMKNGFRIARLKNKYGGKLRYIVYQNLQEPLTFAEWDARYARLDDLDTQKGLFHAGHYGVALAQCRDLEGAAKEDLLRRSYVIFKRPSTQQVVHVVRPRPKPVDYRTSRADFFWLPDADSPVQWNIVGDATVTGDGALPIRFTSTQQEDFGAYSADDPKFVR